jgi:hypothetical protein
MNRLRRIRLGTSAVAVTLGSPPAFMSLRRIRMPRAVRRRGGGPADSGPGGPMGALGPVIAHLT